MTRKDFVLIAATLNSTKPPVHWNANKMAHWVVICNAFADRLRITNPEFKRDRFLTACGLDD